MATKVKKHGNTGKSKKWDACVPLRVYRMLRAGLSDIEVCKSLKVSRTMYYRWMRDHPELQDAVDTAKKEQEDGGTFPAWVYSRLSPKLKGLWERIEEFNKDEQNAVVMIEKLLMDQGKRVRQQLFLHALCNSLFNPSEAMAAVNITRKELTAWVETDLEFAELMTEIQWHKKNWVEEKLMQLVNEENPQAVIYANKTLNNDRGYGNLGTMTHEHSGEVLHGVLDLADLMPLLTQPAKMEILEALRGLEERKSKSLARPVDVLVSEITGASTHE